MLNNNVFRESLTWVGYGFQSICCRYVLVILRYYFLLKKKRLVTICKQYKRVSTCKISLKQFWSSCECTVQYLYTQRDNELGKKKSIIKNKKKKLQSPFSTRINHRAV